MRPQPVWERWMKDPNKAFRMHVAWGAVIVLVNVLIVVGFLIFLWFVYKIF
ncbi:MAG: hypothetical protein ABH879_04255 [archaeon]